MHVDTTKAASNLLKDFMNILLDLASNLLLVHKLSTWQCARFGSLIIETSLVLGKMGEKAMAVLDMYFYTIFQ